MSMKILSYKEKCLLNRADRYDYLETLRRVYKKRKTTNTRLSVRNARSSIKIEEGLDVGTYGNYFKTSKYRIVYGC